MAVAAFVRHGGDPFGKKELSILYALFALGIMLIGPGRYSLDAILRRRRTH